MQGVVYKSWYSSIKEPLTPKFNLMHFDYICTKYKEAEYNPGTGFSLWGKFPQSETPGNINDFSAARKTILEVSKRRTIYRNFISLDGETADAKDMNSRENWQKFTEKRINIIAEEYGIEPDNFCWGASFHFKVGHPHVHIMFWDNSDDVRPEFIPKPRFHVMTDKIREDFNKELFAQELKEVYKQQDDVKKLFKNDFTSALSMLEQNHKPNELAGEVAKLLNDAPTGNEVDNTLYTAILQDDALIEISKKLYAVSAALPQTGSLDYKYLSTELKAAVDALTDTAINAVPSFKEKYQAFEKSVKKACEIYGNSEAGAMHNIEAARKKLYTDTGNIILKWLKKNRVTIEPLKTLMRLNENEQEISKKTKNIIHETKDKVSNNVNNQSISSTEKVVPSVNDEPCESLVVLGDENDEQPLGKAMDKSTENMAILFNLFPESYKPRREYLKNDDLNKALNATIRNIMKSELIKNLISQRVVLAHSEFMHNTVKGIQVLHPEVTDDAAVAQAKEMLKTEQTDHFEEMNNKRKENNLKPIDENIYWRESGEVYKLVRENVIKNCEDINKWEEQFEQRQKDWLQRREEYERNMHINCAVNLVINLSRLFKSNNWNNYRDYILSQDKSLQQRKNIRNSLKQRSSLRWDPIHLEDDTQSL